MLAERGISVIAMLYTGCRPGELQRLRWSDIDFEGRKVAIYRPKVGNYDFLDLHQRLASELLGLRARREGAVHPNDAVFLNRYGAPWKDMRRAWKRTVEAAGLDGRQGLTLYSLRHTFATHFLEGGGATTDLQAQLGHSDLSTTQTYADMVSKRRRDSVLGMDYGSGRTSEPRPMWSKARAS